MKASARRKARKARKHTAKTKTNGKIVATANGAIRSARRAKPGQPTIVLARQVGSTLVMTVPKPLRRVFKVKVGDKVRLDASVNQLLATLA